MILSVAKKAASNEDDHPEDGFLTGDHVRRGKDPLDPAASDPSIPHWKTRDYNGNTVPIPSQDSTYYAVGYQLSTFDANANGSVELPVVSDSATITADDESSPLKVQRQTIIHEMGHAVGIRNPEHPCGQINVMCGSVHNWNAAGVFDPDALRQIIIHNKTE